MLSLIPNALLNKKRRLYKHVELCNLNQASCLVRETTDLPELELDSRHGQELLQVLLLLQLTSFLFLDLFDVGSLSLPL